MKTTETVVVACQASLLQYLIESDIVPANARVISHAVPADVRGKRVIGVIPLHLAVECKSVTEIPMILPPELRGVELTLEQVRQYAQPARQYCVRNLADVLLAAHLTDPCALADLGCTGGLGGVVAGQQLGQQIQDLLRVTET